MKSLLRVLRALQTALLRDMIYYLERLWVVPALLTMPPPAYFLACLPACLLDVPCSCITGTLMDNLDPFRERAERDVWQALETVRLAAWVHADAAALGAQKIIDRTLDE